MTIKRNRGRPEVKRSEDLARRIKSYSAVGVPAADIARTCGMGESTLRKLYSEELATASIDATAKVAGKLYQQCMDGNTAAIIFWLKTRAKWSEKHELELTGKNGGPIQTQEARDMSDAELDVELARYGIKS